MEEADQIGQVIRGTCTSMCPVPEAKRRATCGLLYLFEATEASLRERRLEPDFDKAVTSYQRSAAGTSWKPDDIRTPETLLRTVNHLMTTILSYEGHKKVTLRVLYEFVHDRLRAVRQELVIQRVNDEIRREILEQAVIFYAISCLKMAPFHGTEFNSADNNLQIHTCLSQLIGIYDRQSSGSVDAEKTKEQLNRRCLVESINILFNIKLYDKVVRYCDLPDDVKKHKLVEQSLKIYLKLATSNFYCVLKESSKLNYILFSALSPSIAEIQGHYVARLTKASSTKNQNLLISVEYLAKVLFPFEEETVSLSNIKALFHGLKAVVSKGNVNLNSWTTITEEEVEKYLPRKMKQSRVERTWHQLIEEAFCESHL